MSMNRRRVLFCIEFLVVLLHIKADSCPQSNTLCAVDPCANKRCSRYPQAVCHICGACEAAFFVDGKRVCNEDSSFSPSQKLIAYWGQDSGQQEKELITYCKSSNYDVIVLAFVTDFFAKKGYPKMYFDRHCPLALNGTNLLDCPAVGDATKLCQRNGKQVIISLGGARGGYNLSSAFRANELANTIWDLFLGGKGKLRPFGDAILDGVDLDIERGSDRGYPAFIRELRLLMNKDITRKYIITGAPQCARPDRWLGRAIHEQGHHFDYLYVQHYNNYCSPRDLSKFIPVWNQWLLEAVHIRKRHGHGPKICLGLPAHKKASSSSTYFMQPLVVNRIFQKYKWNEVFGGFMIWSVGWDEENRKDGDELYSYYLKNIIDGHKWGRPRLSGILRCGASHKADCDARGSAPCCSSNGWCGNSSAHCNCDGCVDFRTYGYKWGPPRLDAPYRCGASHKADCDARGSTPCCSSQGWCGSSIQHCECDGCTDFRKYGQIIPTEPSTTTILPPTTTFKFSSTNATTRITKTPSSKGHRTEPCHLKQLFMAIVLSSLILLDRRI